MAEAHEIVRKGFDDLDWDFGLSDARTGEETVVTGVWLSDRPLSQRDGIDGDALLRIEVDALEDELAPFALEGLLWNAKLWVVPSEWVNARGTVRFAEVDPRSSGRSTLAPPDCIRRSTSTTRRRPGRTADERIHCRSRRRSGPVRHRDRRSGGVSALSACW
jgi:hypothetical protein